MSCSKTQRSDAGEARTATLRSRVKHSATEPLRSNTEIPYNIWVCARDLGIIASVSNGGLGEFAHDTCADSPESSLLVFAKYEYR